MWVKIYTLLITISLLLFIFPVTSINSENMNCNSFDVLTPDSDNSYGDATIISVAGTMSGSVNETDDRFDYYKVKLNSSLTDGDLLNVNYTITDIEGIGFIGIHNPEYYQVGSGICMIGLNDYVNSTICACTTGWYYILIAGFGSETSYQINVTWKSVSRAIDTDNSNATANTASSGGSYNGNIDPIYDYLDLYNLTVTSGTTTTEGVEVELLYYLDKKLVVYSPDGTIRDSEDTISSSDPHDKEKISFAADQTGVYRIAVVASHGLFSEGQPTSYTLNTTIVSGIPPDNDYDWQHAILVYNGTELNLSFDSKFDHYDMFMIDLNQNDNLTVSILFNDGYGDVDIWIRSETVNTPDQYITSHPSTGAWGWSILDETCRHYIEVERDDYIGNYSILFSLNGENLWFQDDPMIKNDINLDFNMLEDTVDLSHVNLKNIFFDPDSPIIFDSPSHPNGEGENIDMEILLNGSVKFTPHENYNGYELFNFSASDVNMDVLYWEVNVTVLPVNDLPEVELIGHQIWTQDVSVNILLEITDVDDTDLNLTDNTTLFDVDSLNRSIHFTPVNDQVGYYYISIKISDGEDIVNLNFTAEILNKNDPPNITKIGDELVKNDTYIVFFVIEDKWYNYSVEVHDIDIDIGIQTDIYFNEFADDPYFTINQTTGLISFRPKQKHVGIFTVKICAYDIYGGFDYNDLKFYVENVNDPPTTPVIELLNVSGLTVTCEATQVVDDDGDLLTYYWDFGDGSTTKQVTPAIIHTYSYSGNYTITVNVADDNGGLSTGTIEVSVIEPMPDINDLDNQTDIDNHTNEDNSSNDDNNTNGNFIDTDLDKLDDVWEIYFFGNLSADPDNDYDQDGFTNYEEYINGTNPLDGSSHPDPKDDEEEKEDTKPLSLSESILIFIILVTIITILIISILLIIRKKGIHEEDKWWDQWQTHNKVMVNCPECGRKSSEDLNECPYCRSELPDIMPEINIKKQHQRPALDDDFDSEDYDDSDILPFKEDTYDDEDLDYDEDQLEEDDDLYWDEDSAEQDLSDEDDEWEYNEEPEVNEPEMEWDEESEDMEFEDEDEVDEDEEVDWD
jgi:hypothetical protein